MNIEVNKTNLKVEGNNLVIELTEELRKSLGMITIEQKFGEKNLLTELINLTVNQMILVNLKSRMC